MMKVIRWLSSPLIIAIFIPILPEALIRILANHLVLSPVQLTLLYCSLGILCWGIPTACLIKIIEPIFEGELRPACD